MQCSPSLPVLTSISKSFKVSSIEGLSLFHSTPQVWAICLSSDRTRASLLFSRIVSISSTSPMMRRTNTSCVTRNHVSCVPAAPSKPEFRLVLCYGFIIPPTHLGFSTHAFLLFGYLDNNLVCPLSRPFLPPIISLKFVLRTNPSARCMCGFLYSPLRFRVFVCLFACCFRDAVLSCDKVSPRSSFSVQRERKSMSWPSWRVSLGGRQRLKRDDHRWPDPPTLLRTLRQFHGDCVCVRHTHTLGLFFVRTNDTVNVDPVPCTLPVFLALILRNDDSRVVLILMMIIDWCDAHDDKLILISSPN